MILELYRLLKEIAENEYKEIIEDTGVIFSHSGRARKLRIKLMVLQSFLWVSDTENRNVSPFEKGG